MSTIRLRDGSTTEDARLDRLIEFDPRSLNYPVSEILPEGFRSKTWRLNERNDQGPDGACVGFGTGHRLAAAPIEVGGVDYKFSFDLYRAAQQLDPWEGDDYEGTSVLAGIQAAANLGFIKEYRWCFTIEDYIRALAFEGPVLVGTWWDHSMFRPDDNGLISPDGNHAGGHCYLLRGVTLKPRFAKEPVFRITNSWGKGWGKNGEAYITVSDFESKLMPDGEGAVLLEQRRKRPASVEPPRTRSAWPRSPSWWFA
jgi:hypothetical protein